MIEYTPIKGFIDLREYEIPKKEFVKLYGLQKFLADIEKQKKYYMEFNKKSWEEAKEISGKLQQAIFSYPKKERHT